MFSHICSKCFIWMLRNVYSSFQVFFWCFYKCFQRHVSSVSSVLFYMLQMLYLNVSKVDRGCCTWDTRGEREGE
jgi:hypothetical protein